MSAAEEVRPIFDKALALLEEREQVYGDSWRVCGAETCVNEIFRKQHYLEAQWKRGRSNTSKFLEDLLDTINWSAFAYWHISASKEKE